MDVATRLKKALFDKGWSQKKLCQELNITENGLKNMITNNSWKLETVERISNLLGLPLTYFLIDEDYLDSAPRSTIQTGAVEKALEELKALFEEELRIKNQQIAGLQRTVDVLVGKSEGASIEPTSTAYGQFKGVINQYLAVVADQFGLGELSLGSLATTPLLVASPEQKLVAPSSSKRRARH